MCIYILKKKLIPFLNFRIFLLKVLTKAKILKTQIEISMLFVGWNVLKYNWTCTLNFIECIIRKSDILVKKGFLLKRF